MKPRGQGWNSDQEERLGGQQAHAPLANIPQDRGARNHPSDTRTQMRQLESVSSLCAMACREVASKLLGLVKRKTPLSLQWQKVREDPS